MSFKMKKQNQKTQYADLQAFYKEHGFPKKLTDKKNAWNSKKEAAMKAAKQQFIIDKNVNKALVPEMIWVKKTKPTFDVNSSPFVPSTLENKIRTEFTDLEQFYMSMTKTILPAVHEYNNTIGCRNMVGYAVFPFVQQLVNEKAQKVTEMIITYCNMFDLRAILTDHKLLVIRVAQANEYLTTRQQVNYFTEKTDKLVDDDNTSVQSMATQASDFNQMEEVAKDHGFTEE